MPSRFIGVSLSAGICICVMVAFVVVSGMSSCIRMRCSMYVSAVLLVCSLCIVSCLSAFVSLLVPELCMMQLMVMSFIFWLLL